MTENLHKADSNHVSEVKLFVVLEGSLRGLNGGPAGPTSGRLRRKATGNLSGHVTCGSAALRVDEEGVSVWEPSRVGAVRGSADLAGGRRPGGAAAAGAGAADRLRRCSI